MGKTKEKVTVPNLSSAYSLLDEGAEALSQVEYNGLQIDTAYCERADKSLGRRIQRIERRLEGSKEVKLWKRVYKDKFNIDSSQQLGHVLFRLLKHKPPRLTEKGAPSVDKIALAELNLPLVNDILTLRKIKKARSTYIKAILRETVDGVLHPFFNLNTVTTYRSSSDRPNFQNIPIRDPEISEIVRRAFIPRPGRQLLEVDYSGIEVCIAACYHKDPNMIEYLCDKKKDMHRDMAMSCYLLQQRQVSKMARYSAKNGFVFPQFYGDYYVDCAKSLWKNIGALSLTLKGTNEGMRKHLSRKGIHNLSQFEAHIQKVEKTFWNKMFPDYRDWKEDQVKRYDREGYLDMFTGFRCSGFLKKNEIVNYPIQGSAFHCLLWSLIQLNKFLTEGNWKSMIVGQIHDSILLDVEPTELRNLLIVIDDIMVRCLKKAWPWIIVPLEVEAEVTPINAPGIDASWHKKQPVEIPA